MSNKTISGGNGISTDELAARLEPTFQEILTDAHGRDTYIPWIEKLLAGLPAQFLAAIDEAGFDPVRRVGSGR